MFNILTSNEEWYCNREKSAVANNNRGKLILCDSNLTKFFLFFYFELQQLE